MSRLGHAGVGEDGVNSYQVYKYVWRNASRDPPILLEETKCSNKHLLILRLCVWLQLLSTVLRGPTTGCQTMPLPSAACVPSRSPVLADCTTAELVVKASATHAHQLWGQCHREAGNTQCASVTSALSDSLVKQLVTTLKTVPLL